MKKKPIIFSLRIQYYLFVKTCVPFTQRCFVLSLVEIGQVVLEKKMKMWKVDGQMENGDQKSSL